MLLPNLFLEAKYDLQWILVLEKAQDSCLGAFLFVCFIGYVFIWALLMKMPFLLHTENVFYAKYTFCYESFFSGTACTMGSNYPVSIFSKFTAILFPISSCLFPLLHIVYFHSLILNRLKEILNQNLSHLCDLE